MSGKRLPFPSARLIGYQDVGPKAQLQARCDDGRPPDWYRLRMG